MDVLRLIHKALSDTDIGTILGTDAKIIRYSELRHIDDLGELLTKGSRLLYYPIRETDPTDATERYNGIYEHFDAYVNKPDKSLEWVKLKMRRRLNEATPYLTNLLHKNTIYTQASSIKTETAMTIRADPM
ncbi:MAG: hypothetical protein ACKPKO_04620, partial [Candidatus Fonsibacter sp.]